MKPYETPCPACGAPPERVTKKQMNEGSIYGGDEGFFREPYCKLDASRVTKDHIAFHCNVCGKRWAEEVVPCAGYEEFKVTNKNIVSPLDIKELQEALGSKETSAAVLVGQALMYLHGFKDIETKLRDEVNALQTRLKVSAAVNYLTKDWLPANEAKTLRDEVTTLQPKYKLVVLENSRLRAEVAGMETELEYWRKAYANAIGK